MTRLTIISTIFIIALVVTASAYYLSADYNSKDSALKESTVLSARKEELLASQTNMDNKIAELQQTVQKAIQDQQKLNTQVTQLQKDVGTLDPSKSTTTTTTTTYTPPVITKPTVTVPSVPRVTTPTPTPTPTPAPTPAPTPTPTTRAS